VTAPLVLLHHAGGSSRRWSRILPGLEERYEVHALDLPGHGGRPVPEGSAWAAWKNALPRYLEEKGIARPAVVAHSLSGLALTTRLLDGPLDLAALVLVAPPPGRRDLPSPIRISRPGAAKRAATWKTYQRAVRQRMAVDITKITEQEWQSVHDDFVRTEVQRTLHTLLPEYPSLEDLPLPVPDAPPTLIVWGSEDRMVPLRCMEQWRAAYPGAETCVLPDVGHLPMLEDAEGFLGAVDGFLARNG
jgi:3-oxoadipate enol-lactonase